MYPGVCVLVLLLLQQSMQVGASCQTCECGSSPCNDPYSGTYQEACGSTTDPSLCSKYDGCYDVKCTNPTMTCYRHLSSCNQKLVTSEQVFSGVDQPYHGSLYLVSLVVITTTFLHIQYGTYF